MHQVEEYRPWLNATTREQYLALLELPESADRETIRKALDTRVAIVRKYYVDETWGPLARPIVDSLGKARKLLVETPKVSPAAKPPAENNTPVVPPVPPTTPGTDNDTPKFPIIDNQKPQPKRPVRRRFPIRNWAIGGATLAAMLLLIYVVWPLSKSETEGQKIADPVVPPGPTDTTPLDPNALPVNTPIDLLALVKLPEHAIRGNWTRKEDGSIACEPGPVARFMVPVAVAGDYALEATFTRHTNNEAFSLLLPVGDDVISCHVDGWGGTITGLELIDNTPTNLLTDTTAAVRQTSPYENGVQHEVRVTVTHLKRKVAIQLFIDGTKVLDWIGLASSMSEVAGLSIPNQRAIGVVIQESRAEVHSLELTLTGTNGQGYQLPEDDWMNPLMVIADAPPADVVAAADLPYIGFTLHNFNGKQYLISKQPMNFSEARRLAFQVKGRLLTISSKEEEDFICGEANPRALWMSVWCAVDRNWKDDRNRPLEYIGPPAIINGRAQPDGGDGGVENQMIVHGADHTWNDVRPESSCHACIEWGEEYPAEADTLTSNNSKVVSSLASGVGQSSQALTGSKAGGTREITLSGGVKLVQVWCPAGTFKMGSPITENGRSSDEDQVDVTLTQGFWLGQTEVTQGQWEAVMGTTPWTGENYVQEGATYPATYVGWYDAVEFCNKLSASQQLTPCYKSTNRQPATGSIESATVEFVASGTGYRLPTEAQWEYACRAGTTTDYSFGDNASKLGEYAWFRENAFDVDQKYAHIVGQKKPNPWGLFDMHGNVYEWCQDGYETQLPGGSDPLAPGYSWSTDRSLRGGSWGNGAGATRSAFRVRREPGNRDHDNGFRVCLSVRTSQVSEVSFGHRCQNRSVHRPSERAEVQSATPTRVATKLVMAKSADDRRSW